MISRLLDLPKLEDRYRADILEDDQLMRLIYNEKVLCRVESTIQGLRASDEYLFETATRLVLIRFLYIQRFPDLPMGGFRRWERLGGMIEGLEVGGSKHMEIKSLIDGLEIMSLNDLYREFMEGKV